MSEYFGTLSEAVEHAISEAENLLATGMISGTNCLSAQRRILAQATDNEERWFVRICGEFADFATHITDTLEDFTDATEIESLIEGCWDAEWDDIQKDFPVGDYRMDSSDFHSRARAEGREDQ